MKQKPYAVVVGTRPEIIKLSPVIRHLEKTQKPFFVVHTGQHYSADMDQVFFKNLELPKPKYRLNVGLTAAAGHGSQTGRMLEKIEPIFLKERPSVVFVQGDTNSVLAGALAASKVPGVRVAHVEAGLRSYDRAMPEETNRIVADHISDFLFPPTPLAKSILLREGIDPKKIFMTGNTIVDAVRQNLTLALKKVDRSKLLPAGVKNYALMTLHRQENVDHPDRLRRILKGLDRVIRTFEFEVIFPVHPRTRNRLSEFGLKLPQGIVPIPPVGFLEFLSLEKGAKLLLSDSGGVQEEGCILGVPCVTLRTSTERPETISVGANLLAGNDPDKIHRAAVRMMARKKNWKNPFGDGRSAERMVGIVERQLKVQSKKS